MTVYDVTDATYIHIHTYIVHGSRNKAFVAHAHMCTPHRQTGIQTHLYTYSAVYRIVVLSILLFCCLIHLYTLTDLYVHIPYIVRARCL